MQEQSYLSVRGLPLVKEETLESLVRDSKEGSVDINQLLNEMQSENPVIHSHLYGVSKNSGRDIFLRLVVVYDLLRKQGKAIMLRWDIEGLSQDVPNSHRYTKDLIPIVQEKPWQDVLMDGLQGRLGDIASLYIKFIVDNPTLGVYIERSFKNWSNEEVHKLKVDVVLFYEILCRQAEINIQTTYQKPFQ